MVRHIAVTNALVLGTKVLSKKSNALEKMYTLTLSLLSL